MLFLGFGVSTPGARVTDNVALSIFTPPQARALPVWCANVATDTGENPCEWTSIFATPLSFFISNMIDACWCTL